MKLMKATLMRLWRLTRATSIVVGLAVMVALVGGVVSLGLAKPPAGGETPPAGETAAAILKGVTNTATTVTTLINSGTGAALNLVVGSGEPPLTVNPGAGTATGLSADTVDGKDSTDFVSATDGKAPDSELLDGIDSTKFAQVDADGKVANSDKLDGLDSKDFAASSIGTVFTAQTTDRVTIPNDGHIAVLSKQLPAGSYAVNAKVSLENMDDDDSADVGCWLHTGAEVGSGVVIDQGPRERLSENPHINAPESDINISESYPFQAVLSSFGGGAITITCKEGTFPGDSDQVDAHDAVITAISVGSAH
jgi:hypothetical protein